MTKLRLLPAGLAWLVFGNTATAFNGHIVTEGPLRVAIGAIPTVSRFEIPQPVSVTLSNSGPAPLLVSVEMKGLIDTTHPIGETSRRVTVPARGEAGATFQFACGRGTFSAHYPVHVHATFEYGGQTVMAQAVQIFETDFSAALQAEAGSEEFPLHTVPAAGAFALAHLKTHRVVWSYLSQPPVHLPVGWSGSDATSRATFSRGPVIRGGESRQAIQMHPPYVPRAGTVFAEYRLKLPDTQPIRLAFFNAIRDHTETEPPSDGVTFRVWAGDEPFFERHTNSKSWAPGEADLSALAGREILLRLESHPGPKHNTVCDSSFWGDPHILVGTPPRLLGAGERQAMFERVSRMLATGKPAGPGALVHELEGGCRAALELGPNGLADAVLGFGNGARTVLFEGLHLAVDEQVLGQWPSGAVVERAGMVPDAGGRVRIEHRLRLGNKTFDLTAAIWKEGPGWRIRVECPEPITGLGLKAADQKASRVYYGHGYCIVEPAAFRASAGGHNLATSHVGFDFERGVSLLTASDTPVDYLRVEPEQRLYQLHTHPDSTLTFVPGLAGAFDCAIRYRPLYDKPAAPGVPRKAGRFVFDIWGGRYADDTAKLARCFDYGLTNALVLMHVWQRWGYDYRLPDIFPPLPSLGTLADLQELGRLCTSRGVLWGLHDNYIDFYPDAEGYSYDHITFNADGQPRRAWLNEGREAQSYQWRPDRFLPFLKRNMERIVPAFQPTASFVDVFTSLNSFDFRDRAGKLHSKLETRKHWGEAFAYIREACGNDAPATSEAGSDHLIGWLDGADCQFLQLSPRSGSFLNVVRCQDWARVPWFDAVNHSRFSLHGVGYSSRYEGGRSREEHGIESDDYLSAELLTGHALMMDLAGMIRGAVRKYWLAQNLIESLALDEITGVEFAGGDIHRLIVSWNSGARVHVNRGATDWLVAGRVLPTYGYLAQNGDIESSLERFGAAIAEQSRSAGGFYVNGRGYNPNAPHPITPRAERVEHLGRREFRLVVHWDAQRPTPKDLAVFYHFSRPTPGRRAMTEFYGGGVPDPPTSQWQGRVVTGTHWTIAIPETMPLGEYEILAGLYETKGRQGRLRLLGDEDSQRRYRLGKLVVEGNRTNITQVRLERPVQEFVPSARWLANTEPVDFGLARTLGAFRCEVRPGHLRLTPLPDGEDFPLTLRMDKVVGRHVAVDAGEAVDVRGGSTRPVVFTRDGQEVSFLAARSDFAYRVSWK